MGINDCFKFKGLKDCCIGCLNYEPKVTRVPQENNRVENWVHCANIKGCYSMTELEEIERDGGELYGK